MGKIDKVLSSAHRAAMAYLVIFTIPALLGLFVSDLSPGAARAMERLTPIWGWLMGAWLLSAAYFCCCLVLRPGFRESLLTRISGFEERDEREEIVTARAARSVFLMTLGGLIAAGLIGMIRINLFEYTRWEGDRVPPFVKVGQWGYRKGQVSKKGLAMWPSIGLPQTKEPQLPFTEREVGNTQYFYAGGRLFYGPEVSRVFFGLAAIQVLLFQLVARRVRV